MAVRYQSHAPYGRRIPKVRRAVIDLDDVPAFVGTEMSEVIYIMAEPVAGLLNQWRQACAGE